MIIKHSVQRRVAIRQLPIQQKAFALYAKGRLSETLAVANDIMESSTPNTAILNLAAVCHWQLGNGESALSCWQRAIQLDPNCAEAHSNLGVFLKEQQQLDGAEIAYRRAIQARPHYAEAHFNLGNLLQDKGKHAEAEAAYAHALRNRPDYAEAHNNLGNLLRKQGRLQEAESCLRRAVQIKPRYLEAHNNLAAVLKEQGQMDEAVHSLRRVLSIRPADAHAHNNLGIIFHEQGHLARAELSYRQALQLRPDHAEYHNNLGLLLHDMGRLAEAEASHLRAVEIRPADVEMQNNLARLLLAMGKGEAAMRHIRHALQGAENEEAKSLFVHALATLRTLPEDEAFGHLLWRALSAPWDRPELTAQATIHWLKQSRLFQSEDLIALTTHPLLSTLLVTGPIADPELERFLTGARRTLLEAACATPSMAVVDGVRHFYCHLAQQCFINEYVYAWTATEATRAESLRTTLTGALERRSEVPVLWVVAVASYFPLHTVPLSHRLLESRWPGDVHALLTQQLREPAEEQQIRGTVARLTPIEDNISLLVQKQYEENPYPRWILATPPIGRPRTLNESIRHHLPLAPFQPLSKEEAVDLLIAGCGTGRHVLETMQTLRGVRCLAIDLSLTSLCYAKRKTQELGLQHIEYAQADILKLGNIDRRFDVIEASGVLHHLADPLAGWRILLSLLRPGGFMWLGFYSRLARREILLPHTSSAENNGQVTVETIRRRRQEMMHPENQSLHALAVGSPDFYSTSMCRDLLFHVQEHRMTLRDIQTFLTEQELRFLGFKVAREVLHAYRLRFPDDQAAINLDYWQRFEQDNPDTFSAMYQFWVQKGH